VSCPRLIHIYDVFTCVELRVLNEMPCVCQRVLALYGTNVSFAHIHVSFTYTQVSLVCIPTRLMYVASVNVRLDSRRPQTQWSMLCRFHNSTSHDELNYT